MRKDKWHKTTYKEGAANLPSITHGHTRNKKFSGSYKAWRAMRWRCGNDPYYKKITYCEEWNSFDNFYSDMGDKPSDKHSLDRIDVNDNYSKENCRWCTHKQQSMNRKKRKDSVHKYKGIARTNNKKNPYRSHIQVDSKRVNLGVFKTEEEAALAYNEAAKKYFGEFAILNVIE